MQTRLDHCFTVDVPLQELLDNLDESFASSIASALNIDKLDVRDFFTHVDSGNVQFYRIVYGDNDNA